MKSHLFLFLWPFLMVETCLAYPAIGDQVSWTGTMVLADGHKSSILIKKKVIAFSESTQRWKVRYDITVEGNTSTREEETQDLFTPEQYKTMIANCSEQGGKLETLSTVAGTFDTCRLSFVTPEGIIMEKWWGDIPFGIVSKSTIQRTSRGEPPSPNSSLIEL